MGAVVCNEGNHPLHCFHPLSLLQVKTAPDKRFNVNSLENHTV